MVDIVVHFNIESTDFVSEMTYKGLNLRKYSYRYVIVLEKRDHFTVKLFFQYKQIKVDTQLGFVHNS